MDLMSVFMHEIGPACLTIALLLDVGSYYKQVKKTLRTKKSRHVSTSSLVLRILKDIFLLISLIVYSNWVGVGVHVVSLLACSTTLAVVCKYKPKGWKLFK